MVFRREDLICASQTPSQVDRRRWLHPVELILEPGLNRLLDGVDHFLAFQGPWRAAQGHNLGFGRRGVLVLCYGA